MKNSKNKSKKVYSSLSSSTLLSKKLNTIPLFKYTNNLERQLFIQEIYPQFDLFMNIVNTVSEQCKHYEYEGYNDIYSSDEEGFTYIGSHIVSNKKDSYPSCIFFGGYVYELLYRKYGNNRNYSNVDLHKYCDATGDIDIKLLLPMLELKDKSINSNSLIIPFFNKDNEINPFFSNFTSWIFELLSETFKNNKIIRDESELYEIFPNTVEFDINEYTHISDDVKNDSHGFKFKKIGNFYVVSYFEGRMFKTQIICKIIKDGITVIDHLVEFVMAYYLSDKLGPNPISEEEENSTNNPLNKRYVGSLEPQLKLKNIQKITLDDEIYFIQSYRELIAGNISGYKERHKIIKFPEDEKWKGEKLRHKAINHVARIFYLFELFYQNPNILQVAIISESRTRDNIDNDNFLLSVLEMSGLTFSEIFSKKMIIWLNSKPFLYYYRIIDGNYTTIKVGFLIFFLAYLPLLMMPINASRISLYNSRFRDFLGFLNKHPEVNFIPKDLYTPSPETGLLPLDKIIQKTGRVHNNFIFKLFNTKPRINPEMGSIQIQRKFREYSHKKRNKVELLTKDISSQAILDALEKFNNLTERRVYDIRFDKQSKLASISQKSKDVVKNMINTAVSNATVINTKHKRESSAAKKIQKKFRSYTKKRR